MRKRKFIDKIEVKHGVKYIVRYMDGKEIGKLPYSDFIKYSENLTELLSKSYNGLN